MAVFISLLFIISILSVFSSTVVESATAAVRSKFLFSDNFANLNAWTIVDGSWTKITGGVQGSSSSEALTYAGSKSWTNYQITTQATIPAGGEASIVFRFRDSNNYYWAGVGSWKHQYSISKVVGGTYSEIKSSGTASSNGGGAYTLKVIAQGSTITLNVNGVPVLTTTDTTFGSGAIGLRTYGTTMQIRTLTASTPTPSTTPTATPSSSPPLTPTPKPTSTPTPTPVPTPSPYSSNWLHVVGNQIQNPNGTPFIFKGAAIGTTNWGWSQLNTYTNGNWNENLISSLKASGGNSVRLTITWYQYNPTYLAMVDQVVNWCTDNGVYVIIDFHYGDPNMISNAANDALTIMKNPNAPLNTILTPSASSQTWFGNYPSLSWIGLLQAYASRYANNPTVAMINIMNEPCTTQLSDSALFSVWRSAASQAVNAIYSVNPNVLVAVYGMAWGNSLVDWYNNPLPQNNVVYAAEGAYMAYQVSYNSYSDAYISGNYALGKQMWLTYLTQNDILPMSAIHPVIVMEWGTEQWNGYNPTLEPAYLQFTSDALQVFAQNKIGSEYWTWDINSIGSDNSGNNLGSLNQGLLDYQSWINHTFVLDKRGQLWKQQP